MITTNLTGNFGNHMWYYTICRLVAEKNNYEWGVNPKPTHDYYNGMNQFYFLDVNFGKEVFVDGKNERGLNKYQGIPNEYYDFHKEHIYNGDSCLINMYDENVWNVSDNTMVHLISQSEDYLLERRNDVISWFKFKNEYENSYTEKLKELGIVLDDNLCVINFRGGEYKNVMNLIPNKKYWTDSINQMLTINPNMKFIIVSDDPNYAKGFVGNFPCYHFDIGFDFYLVNNSKYLIIANSSFSWWAAWLNTKSKLTIAPIYWAKHNVSNGYWSLGDSYSKFFSYMNREGDLVNYEECKNNAINFYKENNLL
jgi:hypothetical protein